MISVTFPMKCPFCDVELIIQLSSYSSIKPTRYIRDIWYCDNCWGKPADSGRAFCLALKDGKLIDGFRVLLEDCELDNNFLIRSHFTIGAPDKPTYILQTGTIDDLDPFNLDLLRQKLKIAITFQ